MSRLTDKQLGEIFVIFVDRRNLSSTDPRFVSREAVQFAIDHSKHAADLHGAITSGRLTTDWIDDILAGRLIRRKESASAPIAKASVSPLLSLSAKGGLLVCGLDPRIFWNRALKTDGWAKMRFSKFPVITTATAQARVDFGLIPVFCPAGVLEDVVGSGHGGKYILSEWGRRLTVSSIKRRELLGRWIAIETIPKPNWGDPVGYGPDDKVAKLLGLQRHFTTSWDTAHDGRMTKLVEVLSLSSQAVCLPTAEEMNWVGNLFLLANRTPGTNLPNLGLTRGWEWCENSFGSTCHLVFGNSKNGGLAAVYLQALVRRFERQHRAFRALAVLAFLLPVFERGFIFDSYSWPLKPSNASAP